MSTDAISLILPISTVTDRLLHQIRDWQAALEATGRTHEILLVTSDANLELPNVRILRHEQPLGYGAALRLALAESQHPILCLSKLDYPYTPGDLSKLLNRLGESVDVYGTPRMIEAVNGVRTGVPVPMFWKGVGHCYRLFCRTALNLPFEPLPGWLGVREHLRSWLLWSVMGLPLVDVHSGFKLIRKSVLDRFPIQSDSEFALAEMFAKMTFLTVLVAEEPLSPSSERVSSPSWASDFGRVLREAQFHSPVPVVG